MEIGFGKTIQADFDTTVEKVTQALTAEGFGVLSRIDVSGALKKKLGVSRLRLEILGACHPPSADKALGIAPEVALMLPCNIVIRDSGDGFTRVETINAMTMATFFHGLHEIASDVAARLDRVLEAL